MKILDEACDNFQGKQGTIAISALKKHLKSRFNWQEYGFNRFKDFLETVHHITLDSERLRLKKVSE